MHISTPVLVKLIGRSFKELSHKDPLRLAGATAYFTTFALPAILLIIMQLLTLIFSRQESNNQLYNKLVGYVGTSAATHLLNVLKAFENVADDQLAMILGFAFLVFVATTLFKVIKNSINEIWNIKVNDKLTIRLILLNRFRELTIILLAGILFLFSLFLETMQAMASEEFIQSSKLARIIFNQWTGLLFSIIIVTIWFGVIFSFLPDGRIPARICFTGAFMTSILFTTGKVLIKWLLVSGDLNIIFGKSSAVVLLLLFVFYSSLMFYFGAMYTKLLAESRNISVTPLPHAEAYNPLGK